NLFNSSNGLCRFSSKVPDSITSFLITAFAMDAKTGLSVTPAPHKVTVIKKFFLNLNLPISVNCGEKVEIQAILFNYTGKHQRAIIRMHASDQFVFYQESQTDSASKKLQQIEQDVDANASILITFI